jgi:hypothetical protein
MTIAHSGIDAPVALTLRRLKRYATGYRFGFDCQSKLGHSELGDA